jgi:hypothetical protein
MFAMLPPLTRIPSDAGNSISSPIHRIVCASISEAAGARTQPPTFGLAEAARRSPSIPIGAGDAVM